MSAEVRRVLRGSENVLGVVGVRLVFFSSNESETQDRQHDSVRCIGGIVIRVSASNLENASASRSTGSVFVAHARFV